MDVVEKRLYKQLVEIDRRPTVYAEYTAETLWTDAHISQHMLHAHLDMSHDRASYKLAKIESAIGWIEQRFAISQGARIADFGCGPGLYAIRLAALGAEVTAVDFSLPSLRYAAELAAEQGLSLEFVHGNYLTFASNQRFDLILLISCDFGVLNPTQRAILLKIFRDHLTDNGAILLDVFSMAEFSERQESAQWAHQLGDGFWAAEDYYGFVNSFRYPTERVTLDKFTIVTAQREFTIYNWNQFYDQDGLAQEFSANGLQIDEWYANVAGEPFDNDAQTIAVVAHKSGRHRHWA